MIKENKMIQMSDLTKKPLILMEQSNPNKVKAKNSQTLQTKKENKKRKEDRSDVITRRAKEILLGTDDHIWMCPVCKLADGSCKYAICDDCHSTHLKKQSRLQKDAGLNLAGRRCHHAEQHLVFEADVWWCAKVGNDGEKWKQEEERNKRATDVTNVEGCLFADRGKETVIILPF